MRAEDSLAKAIASSLVGHDSGDPWSGEHCGRRAALEHADQRKCRLPAFWSALPEANHNQICGWERGRAEAPFSGVFLCDPDQHPRVQRHMELMAAEVERAGAGRP